MSGPNVLSVFDLPKSQLSLKRVAWAYGCAKKGSDDERRLLVLLLDTARWTYNPRADAPGET